MTQKEMVLRHMQEKGSITSWEAIMEYGCTRLSQMIYLLKKEGYKINCKVICKNNRYGKQVHFNKYSLYDESEELL